MFATAVRCSKASRRALTSKQANKDFYKGTRQAYLPGGRRTGAPGVHVVNGKSKYRLLDTKVRVFVGPTVETLNTTPLRPYVHAGFDLAREASKDVGIINTGKEDPGKALFERLTREQRVAGKPTWRETAPYESWSQRNPDKVVKPIPKVEQGQAETTGQAAETVVVEPVVEAART